MKTLGKYQLLEKIGSGGFGEVFKAYDPFIKRHVAVKTCLSDDQEIRKRFFLEAEIAGNLQHRNVTTVYDFGLEDDLPYLIQEYLSGEDLDVKIKRRDFLPYPEKLFYLLQIARGLAYAHSKGVIHRDMKPANIRILEDGTTKIMDFGIAKLAQRQTTLTQTGMTLGTAAYLAPEQIRGDPVDHRTDVFSWGILAYEVLTYERPFVGEQISAVIYQILHREPKPIREHWPGIPDDMAALVDRCLSKDAALRFENAAALLRDLETIQKRGRADREEASGASAIEEGETADLRVQGTVPPPSAPAPAAAGLDDLELTSVKLDDKTRTRATPQGSLAMAARRSPVWKYVLLLGVLPALALAIGLWFGSTDRRDGDTLPEPAPGNDQTASDPTSDVGAAPPTSVAPPPPPETVDVGGTDAKAPPLPPPPPPPEPGTLWVTKPAWTDAVTLKVAGVNRALDRDRSVNLKAGTYTVSFELHLHDYQASASLPVTLREGERTMIEVPILQPGALTVRALPGKPQAQVVVDGSFLQKSPMTVKLAPGEHQLAFRRVAGEDPGLERQLVIRPGQETVLTIDLDSGNVLEREKPLN